ncbi:MAG: hypothetical protein S4CHLAM37_14050 [Chlamydiia bacterium]|nr:hypothetical protein [Chlamydiia bacterium]
MPRVSPVNLRVPLERVELPAQRLPVAPADQDSIQNLGARAQPSFATSMTCTIRKILGTFAKVLKGLFNPVIAAISRMFGKGVSLPKTEKPLLITAPNHSGIGQRFSGLNASLFAKAFINYIQKHKIDLGVDHLLMYQTRFGKTTKVFDGEDSSMPGALNSVREGEKVLLLFFHTDENARSTFETPGFFDVLLGSQPTLSKFKGNGDFHALNVRTPMLSLSALYTSDARVEAFLKSVIDAVSSNKVSGSWVY